MSLSRLFLDARNKDSMYDDSLLQKYILLSTCDKVTEKLPV